MDRVKADFLEAMGIQCWEFKADQQASVPEAEVSSPVEAPVFEPFQVEADPVSALDWSALQERVTDCLNCDLHKGRTQSVFGVGDHSASWMVIGEAPGRDEDLKGEPFVGRAGQLLNEMLLSIGLPREKVFIANILKCRPPENRDPAPIEVASCHDYLERQIELVKPDILLAVGRIAAQNLLQTELAVGKLRGKVHYYGKRKIPLVVVYHPAYLLRSPLEKRKAWEDLKLAVATREGSDVAV